MDLDSATPAKRSRGKSKAVAPAADAAPAARSRKGKKTAPDAATPIASEPAVQVTSVTEVVTPDGEVLGTMIATAAYYLAEQRNFEPGHEIEDWLEAERQIKALYG